MLGQRPSTKNSARFHKLNMHRVKRYMRLGIDYLMPHFCPVCRNQSSTYLCDACVSGFEPLGHACTRCALPLPVDSELCGECMRKAPSYRQVISAYHYDSAFSQVIYMLKETKDIRAINQACMKLSELISERYRQGYPEAHILKENKLPELLVPVPIHWRKRWRRGFNQSEIICDKLSQTLRIPYKNAFKKISETQTQKSLNKKQRQKNLANSFGVLEKHIKDKRVAIIDDVMTTGSTVSILSDLALQHSASSVDIWVLARTPAKSA